jgi:hypothetical protein
MASPMLRPLSPGEILDVSFSLFRSAFAPLILIAVVTSGFGQIMSLYIEELGGPLEYPIFWFSVMVASLILGTIGVGATTFLISERYLGRSLTAGAAFGRAVPYFGRILVVSILAGLALMAGALLMLLPSGIILASGTMPTVPMMVVGSLLLVLLVVVLELVIASGMLLAVPALVLEGLPNGTRALSRSWQLTRGLRAKGLLTVSVALFLLIIPTLAAEFLATMFSAGPAEQGDTPLALAAAAVVLSTIISPYVYVVVTVLYYDARVRKEAFDLEMLAAEMQQK